MFLSIYYHLRFIGLFVTFIERFYETGQPSLFSEGGQRVDERLEDQKGKNA